LTALHRLKLRKFKRRKKRRKGTRSIATASRRTEPMMVLTQNTQVEEKGVERKSIKCQGMRNTQKDLIQKKIQRREQDIMTCQGAIGTSQTQEAQTWIIQGENLDMMMIT
jgi:hypothetical protein